ncbi:hypothetical protein G7Y79_00039g075860 [Physcia stellaris]|nr:hypothetical protein G7Y79_00039g075860 [Physcia stellaris]
MEDISVEDFQSYHNQYPSCDNASSPRPMSGLQDSDSDPFSSPSPRDHPSSPPNEPIFDLPSRASSPDTSPQHSGSDDEISVLLSDYPHPSRAPSQQQRHSSPYTPLKIHPSGFRNPSSVRAMQDTTPPHYHLASPPFSPKSTHSSRNSGLKFPTPSRKGTPRSQRSPSKLTSPSKRAAAIKKEYPLVLLHVTLLAIPTPYSRAITPTVLERGILIPHPREDYDLLEERLLESLELRMPRILACGHFHLSEEEEAELAEAAEEERRVQDEDVEEGADDADICADCGRRVRDGRYGAGAGSRRWDIKLYAANGLMRAGAWSAAWREMERVDVEVCPFVNEELKRELEIAKEHEETKEAVEALHDTPTTEESTRIDEEEAKRGTTIDEARMREIYGDDAQDYIDGLHSPSPPAVSSSYPRPHELPLSTLLRNYIVLLSRDPRNLAIALLSLLVLLLAMASRSAPTPAPALYEHPTATSQGDLGVSSSLSRVLPSSSAPVINTVTSELARSATSSASKLEAKEETSASPDLEGRGERDEDTDRGMNENEEEKEIKQDENTESTAGKVLKAVDGMLDLVGGGGDELAE